MELGFSRELLEAKRGARDHLRLITFAGSCARTVRPFDQSGIARQGFNIAPNTRLRIEACFARARVLFLYDWTMDLFRVIETIDRITTR